MNSRKIFVLGALLGATGIAQAELYISPVTRNAVEHQQYNKEYFQYQNQDVYGVHEAHGEYLMKEHNQSLKAFGKNVPLFIAFDNIIPQRAAWEIKIQEGLENKPLSWDGGKDWQSIIKQIEKQNNIFVSINHKDHVIGIGSNLEESSLLSSKDNNIWKLHAGKTLKENLEDWCKLAGWTLSWDEDVDSNYVIEKTTVLKGHFVGEGGVVDKLFYSLRKKEDPLTGEFYKGNSVLFVTRAGFKQEFKL